MSSATTGYANSREHLMDELALVGMFIARAVARGRVEGWLEATAPSIEITDEMLFERFRIVEANLVASGRTLPMDDRWSRSLIAVCLAVQCLVSCTSGPGHNRVLKFSLSG